MENMSACEDIVEDVTMGERGWKYVRMCEHEEKDVRMRGHVDKDGRM
jgi:hypothetical protein